MYYVKRDKHKLDRDVKKNPNKKRKKNPKNRHKSKLLQKYKMGEFISLPNAVQTDFKIDQCDVLSTTS